MENENTTQPEVSTEEKPLSKYELKKQRKEEKRKTQESPKKKSNLLMFFVIAVVVSGLFGGGWWLFSQEPQDASGLISGKGIHWHPELTIMIKGEKQEIPANIGLGVTHNPVHTHDTDGVIHLEFSSAVRENDVRLGKFFEVWEKQFTSECIFEHCSGPEGTLKMKVNGEENTEFGNYMMHDGDKIEIIFE